MKSDDELKIGDKAPAFQAIAVGGEYGDGRSVGLRDFLGATVILYFYPKDDTPGCTAQACSLRDSWKSVRNDAKIFGVSIDSAQSHRKFIDKYSLPFPIPSN